MHLAKILVKENIISLDQIKTAIEEQRRTGKGLSETLIGLGYINENQLVDFLSREYGVPSVNLDEFEIEAVVLKLVPRKTVLEHNVIPIGRSGTTLVVAMSDPSDIIAVDDLRFATGYNIKPVVAPERAIRNAIQKHYGISEGRERARVERNEGSVEEIIRELEDFKKTIREPDEDESELSAEFDSIPPQEEVSPEFPQGKEGVSTSGIFSQGYKSEQRQEETIPHITIVEGEDKPKETESVEERGEASLESEREEEVFKLFGIPLSSHGFEPARSKEEAGSPTVKEVFDPGGILSQEYETQHRREEASLESGQEKVFDPFSPPLFQGSESRQPQGEVSPESESKETVFKESVSPLSREDEALQKHESDSEVPQEGFFKPSDLFSQIYETEQREEISKESLHREAEIEDSIAQSSQEVEPGDREEEVYSKSVQEGEEFNLSESFDHADPSSLPSHELMWQGEKQRDEEQSVILHKEITTSTLSESKEEKEGDFKGTVLVVDDSPTIRKIVSITLERRGYRVFSAADAIQALAKLNEVIPDLILLDIGLPHMDGYRLCRFIKDNSLTKDIPVVMLSGKDGFFDRVRGRMAGAADYIAKPFEPSTLIQMVEKYSRNITDQ